MAQLGRSYAAVPIILGSVDPGAPPTVTGTVAVTQDDQTSAATGEHSISGTAAVTQDDQTSTATGMFGSDVTGTVAQTQDDQTSTASGSEVVGSAVITQDDQTSTASGGHGVSGSSSQTQADQTSTASGSTVTGTSAQTQADQTSSATGSYGGTYILYDDFDTGATAAFPPWIIYNRLGDLANSEENAVIPANVRVSSGTLKIDVKFEDVTIGDSVTAPQLMHYTSGQIAQGTPPFLYGTVDVRAKLPGGTGLWPCIWMLGYAWQLSQEGSANNPDLTHYPIKAFAEIDIAEFMFNSRTSVNCQIHYDPGSGQVDPGGVVSLPSSFNATSGFAVYRLEWSAASAVFKVDIEDGNGFQTIQTITGSGNVPDIPMYLIIHAAVGGNGVGAPSSGTFPLTMEVDYARVSQPAGALDNGSAWIIQDDQTSTAAGSTTVSGTSAQTQDAQTSTASGFFGSVTGTSAQTQDDQTSTATGSTVMGTSAQTQDDQTSTANGGHGVAGTSAQTQADQTSTAVGAFGTDPVGTVAVTQDDQTSTATGTAAGGTVAVTQDDQTSTASGGHGVAGTSSQTQDDQTSTATGSQAIIGTAIVTQDDQVATASGWSTVTGSIVVIQANQTSAGVGLVGLIATDTRSANLYREHAYARTYRGD